MDLSVIKDLEPTVAIAIGAMMFLARSLEAVIGKALFYKDGKVSHFTDDDRKNLTDLHYMTKQNEKSLDRLEREISKLG